MVQNTNAALVATAIGTLGLASIVGSYKLAKTESVSTDYLAEARQPSVINNYKNTAYNTQESLPKGFVTGKLCYPKGLPPEGKITAKNVASGTIYTLYYAGTKGGAKSSYYFVLLPGKYKLRYETFIGTNQLKPYSGYYAQDLNSQTDSSNISPKIVEVEQDSTLTGIDLCYYYPAENEPDF